MEGHIGDRVLDTREAHALAALRQELGVSLPEHQALEQKIRARLRRAA